MWMPPSGLKVFLARDPADMRKSFEGLCGMVRDVLCQEPTSGCLFVFFNRIRDRVKILYFDRTGLCIWYKHIQVGRFQPLRAEHPAMLIDPPRLTLILEGMDLAGAKQKRSFAMNLAQKGKP